MEEGWADQRPRTQEPQGLGSLSQGNHSNLNAPKLTYRLNIIPITIPGASLQKLTNPKTYMKIPGTQNRQIILKKKNKAGGLVVSKPATKLQQSITTGVRKDLQIQGRTQSPGTNTCSHDQRTLSKGTDTSRGREARLFNRKCTRVKVDPCLTPFVKINSEWITDINVRVQTVNLLEENTGMNLGDLDVGNDFLDVLPKA